MENNKGKNIRTISSIITYMVTVTSILAIFYKIIVLPTNSSEDQFEPRLKEIRKQLDSLKIVTNTHRIINVDTTRNSVPLRDIDLKRELDSMKHIIADLKLIMVESPEKAVSIPLLKRDLENVQTNFSTELNSVKHDIDKLYDSMKWMGGLLFALLISLIGISFNNIFFKKKEEKAQDQDKRN